jgi:hypothetical protein
MCASLVDFGLLWATALETTFGTAFWATAFRTAFGDCLLGRGFLGCFRDCCFWDYY